MKNIPIFHFIGIYTEHQFSAVCDGYKRLIAFTSKGLDINVFYTEPFYVERIAVRLPSKRCTDFCELFECKHYAATEVEAKSFAVAFAEELVKYRQSFAEFQLGEIRYHQ